MIPANQKYISRNVRHRKAASKAKKVANELLLILPDSHTEPVSEEDLDKLIASIKAAISQLQRAIRRAEQNV